jgi:hypothetical protein
VIGYSNSEFFTIFFNHKIISAAGAGGLLTAIIGLDIPFGQHIAQVIIFTLTGPDIKVLIYIESSIAGIARPALPRV